MATMIRIRAAGMTRCGEEVWPFSFGAAGNVPSRLYKSLYVSYHLGISILAYMCSSSPRGFSWEFCVRR